MTRAILLLFCLLLAGPLIPIADAKEHKLMPAHAEKDTIEIYNSGSTNSAGYRLYVSEDGSLKYETSNRRLPSTPGELKQGAVPRALSARLFADARAAMPFSQYPEAHCAKSASFGFTLTVSYQQQTSPDLTCGKLDAKLEAVYKDALEIADALKINAGRFHPLPEEEQGKNR